MTLSYEELERALEAATRREAELQAWTDAAVKENEPLRARATAAEREVAHLEKQFAVLAAPQGDGAQLTVENRKLVERLSELESTNHALRALSTQLANQVEATGQRTIDQLTTQLEAARRDADGGKAQELEAALIAAREAVATLQVQREGALDQVRRYVQDDARAGSKAEAEIARLAEVLAERAGEAEQLNLRLLAHEAEENKLRLEVTSQHERACIAEEKLGRMGTEAALMLATQEEAAVRNRAVAGQLEETREALAAAVEQNRALAAAALAPSIVEPAPAPAPANTVTVIQSPPPPPVEATRAGDEPEGYSPQRIHHLEVLLAAEKVKSQLLQDFAATCEASLARAQDELEGAGGRLADLGTLLKLSSGETGEVMERLEAARRELHALKRELTLAMAGVPAPAEDEQIIDPNDVLEAPLAELTALDAGQGAAAREVAAALSGEQRAREELLGDLSWLKAELEKLTNVREDLRQRVRTMVHRELSRKQVVGALLQKLRTTEVAAAARAGTLRRLHAAIELAQQRAAKVQTIYFQKQIGSMQRQLERRAK